VEAALESKVSMAQGKVSMAQGKVSMAQAGQPCRPTLWRDLLQPKV